MPVITCPKCKGQMRFPEDTPPRRVKCPVCGNVFISSEGESPLTASPSGRHPAPTGRDTREYDGDDRRGRRRRDDDDDDDRDRRSRRRRDDEEDDRPRRRRDEEDDYDDRPRRVDRRAIEGQFGRTSLACLLLIIGGWLQVGGLGLLVFTWFLDWIGVQEGLRVFLVIAGLLGLGHWLTSAVGLGFLVSGPRPRGALGLSIATAAVGGLHLMLLIVVATSRHFGGFGSATHGYAADVHWDAFVTQARAIPILLFWELGAGDIYRGVAQGSLFPVLTNLLEVARWVLLLLALRAIMLCARDAKGTRLGMQATVGYGIGAGALLLLGVLFGLLLLAARPTQPGPGAAESASAVRHLFFLVLYLILAGLAVGTTLVIRAMKNRIDYRA